MIGTAAADAPWPRRDALISRVECADPFDALEDDEALLLYTGGPTGRAKGVPLTHRNIASNALQLGIERGQSTPTERQGIPGPGRAGLTVISATYGRRSS